MAKYFVFIDESWTAKQDPFFWLWCLIIPETKIWEYNSLLQKKYDQILSQSKVKESEILWVAKWEHYDDFMKWRLTPYEMKFKNINQTTLEWYKRLFSQYFKFDEAKFCALVIDRKVYPFPDSMSYFDAYLNQLCMLLRNNFNDSDEFVILPDSITVPNWRNYEKELKEKLLKYNKQCFWVCRLESHSNVFLQMVDCLIWCVLADNKWIQNEAKLEIVNKVKEKTGLSSFKEKVTIHKPNYFNIWKYHK